MLRRINNIIKKLFRQLKMLNSSRGQVAVILLLVTAIALIIYAVSLNFGKASQVKALTTVAANAGGSILASQMASYGESVFQTTLGGQKKVCAWTGILAAIIAVIITIIAVILAIITGGPGAILLAVVGVILATAALAIQVVYIQPGITDMWNKITQATLSISDQFIEQGLRTGLQNVVTDTVNVPDVNDQDTDTVWGFTGQEPNDKVSRFSAYYTALLQGILLGQNLDLEDFMDELDDFLHDDPGVGTSPGWGLYDPWSTACPAHSCCYDRVANPVIPSECNRCCVPTSTINPIDGSLLPLRPLCCDTGDASECGVSTTCGAQSPYGNLYPFVYEAFLDNADNAFFSFREQLGRDDEHTQFSKDPDNPNAIPQFSLALPEFQLEDTTGFYVDPPYTPVVPDNKKGIFDFFYKIADWGVELNLVNPLVTVDECHWCDPLDIVNCLPCPADHPIEMPQLTLPLDPADITSGLQYNLSYFVDGTTTPIPGPPRSPLWPPLAVDKFSPVVKIVAADDVCAQTTFSALPSLDQGFWKRGGDRFCTTTWPYFDNCPKNGGGSCSEPIPPELGGGTIPASCNCGDPSAPPASMFPDDVLDDIIYGVPEFLEWAEDSLDSYRAAPTQMAGEFEGWYEDAAMWIEPGTNPPASGGSSAVPLTDCYKCNPEDGALVFWLKEMTGMIDRMEDFLDNAGAGYAGADCKEVWCVPPGPLGTCPEVPPEEEQTFDFNLNTVQGDLEDIAQCLNYNVEGYDFTLGKVFDEDDNIVPNEDVIAFSQCFNDCSTQAADTSYSCSFLSDGGPLPDVHSTDGVTPYIKPGVPIDPALDCLPANWVAGNVWYDAIDTNRTDAALDTVRVTKGNYYRFNHCGNTCGVEFCYELPRSIVPLTDYDPTQFKTAVALDPQMAGRFADAHAFRNCIDSCGIEHCTFGAPLPAVATWDGATLYNDPGTPIDPVNDCLPPNWGPGNAWYDAMVANINIAALPDDPALEDFIKCHYQCGLTNCTFSPGPLPLARVSDGIPYIDPGVPIDPAVDCLPANWIAGNVWYDAIVQNITMASVPYGALCDVENPTSFINMTRQSALEANNQMAKFTLRRDYLKNRSTELNDALLVLREGATEFNEFLTGPVQNLIQARANYNAGSASGGTFAYHTIYGWQSKPPEGLNDGYWHIVRVDARSPRRCDNACNTDQTPTGDPEWPRVKTYTKNWGTQRCYELENTEGTVKMRVTRFDEDRRSNVLAFPNGVPIWDFRFFHPARFDSSLTPTSLAGTCDSIMLPDPSGLPAGVFDIYKGAFIMNHLIPSGQPGANENCWNMANEILKMGVTSETCAKYYFDDSINGFSHLFVPCREF